MWFTDGRECNISKAWFPYNRLLRKHRLCRLLLRTGDREQLRRFLPCSVSIYVNRPCCFKSEQRTGSCSTRRHVLMTKKCIVGYLCIASVVRIVRTCFRPLKLAIVRQSFPIISNAMIEHGSVGTIKSLLM